MKKIGIFLLILFIAAAIILFFLFKREDFFNKEKQPININNTNYEESNVLNEDDSKKVISQGCVSKDCEELIISDEKTSKTVDLIILSAEKYYGDYNGEYYQKSDFPIVSYPKEEFISDSQKFLDDLFSVSPFNEYKDKFNIYLYNKNLKCYAGVYGTVCGLDFNKLLNDSSQYNQEIGYFDIYLILEPGEGGGLSGTTMIGKGKNSITNVHEIGHYFGLWDAYNNYSLALDTSTNICSDFSCCGGRMCSQDILDSRYARKLTKEEIGECCAPTIPGSKAYSVIYGNIMGAGGRMDLVFSDASIKIINDTLFNWEDCYKIDEQGIYTAHCSGNPWYCKK